ncbi:iron ABC transporter substrate-binding protein [Paracoccus suum]|uniref:Iron ABC transporter substrate-binding protein n=1 Tax=Paracoccus suum TaxID=2259340 RepID=A0A344PI08_9RHOB|nr:siderophore ABC transporter substrate-binding protein [Paracoccus suum]AXC49013.1 iron ABC transporter substrate-binding protein [Paracoccus suum]
MRGLALSGLMAAALAAFTPLSAGAADVTVATAQGEASVPQNPAKVAVFDLSAADTLLALGVQPAGLPDKVYLKRFDDAAGAATKIGTLFEPNLEALAGLGPDLAIVGGRSATQREAVAKLAPTIDMTIGTDVLADARARLDAYGKVFGKEADAAALAKTLDEKLAGLKDAGAGKGTALFVMTNGNKMAAYGPGSRFGWLHDVTGLAPAATGLDPAAGHGDAISHEFIAQTDPDWLLVMDRSAAVGEEGPSAEATLKTPLVEGTKAWKAGHVVYLPSGDLYLSPGGYTALTGILDSLTAALKG